MIYQNFLAKGLTVLWLVLSGVSYGQKEAEFITNDSIIKRLQVYDSFDLPSDFKSQYRNALRRARRVYPLALEAARVIDSLDNELESIDKNRKQNKMMRKAHKTLKNDFKFLLKDLYVSEGIVLTKLIYRETGMTVTEIISQYKNGFQASLYTGLASFFEQDLDAKYYPDTEDFVLECVIRDINSGKVDFDPEFELLTRKEFRQEKKEAKQNRLSRKEQKERLNKFIEMANANKEKP